MLKIPGQYQVSRFLQCPNIHFQSAKGRTVVVCMGLINLGVQLGTTGVVAYVVDCHREQAGEAFAAMNVSWYTSRKKMVCAIVSVTTPPWCTFLL